MNTTPPILETARLYLRPLTPLDTHRIQQMASAQAIADTMISIPHPYPEGEAERWMARQTAALEEGHAMTFAVDAKPHGPVIGIVEIRDINREHLLAELSFWLAVDAWGQGYTSEILAPVIDYAFDGLHLNRLYAYHMVRNPASGRVLEKNGFRPEGILRQRVRKWGVFEDVVIQALLREDRLHSTTP